MMRTHSLILAFATMTAVASLATGQQPPDKKDPQQAIEPRSGPGAGQKYLAQYVGEWTVQKAFFPRGGGEPTRMKGTCKQEMVHDGRFLKSEFVFETPSGKATGTGLIGFEPESGLFTSSWIDSRQTRMSFRKSKAKFTGDKIELLSQNLGGEPETRKSRTVSTIEDGGKKIVHRQYSVTTDNTDRLVMELVLTRK